jgi:hypothetical protein
VLKFPHEVLKPDIFIELLNPEQPQPDPDLNKLLDPNPFILDLRIFPTRILENQPFPLQPLNPTIALSRLQILPNPEAPTPALEQQFQFSIQQASIILTLTLSYQIMLHNIMISFPIDFLGGRGEKDYKITNLIKTKKITGS